ncbi:hypothetical protein D3C72_2039180 [compost metagenome]
MGGTISRRAKFRVVGTILSEIRKTRSPLGRKASWVIVIRSSTLRSDCAEGNRRPVACVFCSVPGFGYSSLNTPSLYTPLATTSTMRASHHQLRTKAVIESSANA